MSERLRLGLLAVGHREDSVVHLAADLVQAGAPLEDAGAIDELLEIARAPEPLVAPATELASKFWYAFDRWLAVTSDQAEEEFVFA